MVCTDKLYRNIINEENDGKEARICGASNVILKQTRTFAQFVDQLRSKIYPLKSFGAGNATFQLFIKLRMRTKDFARFAMGKLSI